MCPCVQTGSLANKHTILLLNYTILGHTRWFAASAYCVQYLSIACDAASGHTCLSFASLSLSLRCRRKKLVIPDRIGLFVCPCEQTGSLATYNTQVLLKRVLSSQMTRQSILPTRPKLAKVARVRLLPSVRSQVLFQRTLPTRPILAKVARVRLFPSVRSQMFCQITLLTRPKLAKVARVRLLPSVCSQM